MELWGDVVELSVMRKGAIVKGFEYDIYLLFKHVPIGVIICLSAGNSEGVDFPAMVASTHSENNSASGQNVGHGEVLGQTQRMPHWGDVEATAESDILCEVSQVNAEEQQVRNALVAFRLEMVLRQP